MSIILKALKKAEELKDEKGTVKKAHIYQVKNKRIWGVILASFAGIVLLFFMIYLFKSRPVPKSPAKAKIIDVQKNITETMGKEGPAVTESPEVARLHEDAIKQIKEKNYTGAESVLRKALLMKPDDAEMHNHLGLALKNQGRYKEASAAYQNALKLRPDCYEAMNNLAVTYEMLGEREKAKSLYKKALSLKPSYAEAHLNYALLLEAEGKNSEAEGHYHTFLNLSSDEALKSRVRERLGGLRK